MAQPHKDPRLEQYLAEELLQHHALKALLPSRTTALKNVPIAQITANPFQARQRFRNLDQLSQAVQQHGLSSCLLCLRPDPLRNGSFQLIFGERWLYAARSANMTTVPCEIAVYADDELYEIGLLENIRQQDLDPLEEAFALRNILEQHELTLEQLCTRVGRDEELVLQRLALLSTPTHKTPGSAPVGHSALDRFLQRYPDHNTPRAQGNGGQYTARKAAPTGSPSADKPAPQPAQRAATSTAAPARPPAPKRASASTMHTSLIQRTLERDIRTLRGILARWQRVLERGDTEGVIVRAFLAELQAETEHLHVLSRQATEQHIPQD